MGTNIAVFLLDSSLLFEQLFRRLGRLVTAAFAFLSFYTLLVIAFGAVYRLLSHWALSPQFAVGGVMRELAFSEALYFSLVTLATLGYGDVVPVAAAARILVAIQTVTGLLLLLFGFAEIQRSLRERGEH
jgi:voltage-gated potassium channel